MSTRNILVSIVMMLFVTFGVVKGVMYYMAKQKIDKLITPMNEYMHVDYSGISTSIFGPIGVKGLRLSTFSGDEVLTFGRVMLLTFDKDEKEKIPSNISISFEDIRFDTRFLDEITNDEVPAFVKKWGYSDLYKVSNNLQQLGYDKIISDVYIDFSYRKTLGGVKLRFRENIQQLGELDILLDVIGVIPGLKAMGADLKINKMRLMFNDNSYTDRILQYFADKDEKELDVYRVEIVEQLKNYLEKNRISLEDDDIRALKQFIMKPNKLIIAINPYEPVSVENLEFYKREDVPNLLNLTISAKNN